MNKHLKKILFYIQAIYIQAKQWFFELSKRNQVIAIVTAIVVVYGILHLFTRASIPPTIAPSARAVTLVSVSDIVNNTTPLPLLGSVTSRNEAVIRAESSGKLTRVYKKLGDRVVAGQVIGEFENSGERAAVLQAEGAYDAAKAGRDIAVINTKTTISSLGDTKANALNTIFSAYNTMDDVIHVKTDAAYTNPRNNDISFALSVPDATLTLSLEAKRKAIESMLVARNTRNKTLSTNSDLLAELGIVSAEAQTIKTYLDDLAQAYAKALVDTNYSQAAIDGGKANVGIARSSISATIATLTGSKTSLVAGLAAEEIAGRTAGSEGNQTQVRSADAQVKSALGSYNAALSRLEKTVIRSPITGTLNSLTIQTGDYVNQSTQVAVVSNNGALEVISYVNEDDAKRIAVNDSVTIDNDTKGVVTRIAPGIDPVTRKIEVRIGITSTSTTVINGQSVNVEISHTSTAKKVTNGPIVIPISAVKITPQGSYIFTYTASSSSVAAVPVTLGVLSGDSVEIKTGLTMDMSIVKDARGLKDGTVVSLLSQ